MRRPPKRKVGRSYVGKKQIVGSSPFNPYSNRELRWVLLNARRVDVIKSTKKRMCCYNLSRRISNRAQHLVMSDNYQLPHYYTSSCI